MAYKPLRQLKVLEAIKALPELHQLPDLHLHELLLDQSLALRNNLMMAV
jgi:hypothetical protein